MPASVLQVANGLKDSLAKINGLRTFAHQPEQMNPPFAYPELTQVEYHRAFGGGDVVMTWLVHVVVGRWVDRTAYELLDEILSFAGPKSVRACLESDTTLNGVCETLVLSSGTDVTSVGEAGSEFLEVQFALTVHG